MWLIWWTSDLIQQDPESTSALRTKAYLIDLGDSFCTAALAWVVFLTRTRLVCSTLWEWVWTAVSCWRGRILGCLPFFCKSRQTNTAMGTKPSISPAAAGRVSLEHCSPCQPGSSHPAEYQTLHLQMAAHTATGSLASGLRSWPCFSSFMVVVTCVCCNSKPPHQPIGSQPSCRLWCFPLWSPSGGSPCLPGAKLLTVSLIPVHAQAVLALASSLGCRQPPSADPRWKSLRGEDGDSHL